MDDLDEAGASVSSIETVGLSVFGAAMLDPLLRRPNALRISLELVRDELAWFSAVASGRIIDSLVLELSSVFPPPASDNGTVTIESVGSGELSTCVLGEREAFSSMPCTIFATSTSVVVFSRSKFSLYCQHVQGLGQ